jgi:non-ribosomal peptide synthase protein (TIGR01720 family)
MLPGAFVVLGQLPLTPNGKVDRRALPAPDQADRLPSSQAYVPPATPAEEMLAALWAELLGLERVGVHDNFFELGGDSILSIQVVARAHQAGLHLSPRLLFQHQTIAELARAASRARPVLAEQGLVQGDAPLTPPQRWLFERELPQPHHFNLSLLLVLNRPLRPDLLGLALSLLMKHHDALRLRFTRTGDGWSTRHTEAPTDFPVQTVDLSILPPEQQATALEQAAAQAQANLDLAQGPLLRVLLFDLGDSQPGRLLLVLHHLVVDPVSWQILLEDLLTAYHQLAMGLPPSLPPKTTSWQHWARRLAEHARSEAVRQELPFWLDPQRQQVEPLPQDLGRGNNTAGEIQLVLVELDTTQTTALLQEMPKVYRTQINDVLLTALALACARWSGQPRLLVDLGAHGREELFDDIDLSRTVGWFATLYPVLLEVPADAAPGQALQAVKEQLGRVPNRGLGYGLLRYVAGDQDVAEQLRSLPQAEVYFDYLGQIDRSLPAEAGLALAAESSGPCLNPETRRRYLLEVTAAVLGGRLRMSWAYCPGRHHWATVEGLARNFLAALQEVVVHCQSPEAKGRRQPGRGWNAGEPSGNTKMGRVTSGDLAGEDGVSQVGC